jgi:hypothetical protein
MRESVSSLTKWERWALETWLESVRGLEPHQIRWADLPPAQYARALGELATRKQIRLPRRQYGRKDDRKMAGRHRVSATAPWSDLRQS